MENTRSPTEVLIDLSTLHMVARSLHVIAELGVADALDDEPMTEQALARRVDANADAVGRLLRLLATYGVFTEDAAGFRHTASSRLLRADNPDSMRPWVRMMGMDLNWQAYGLLSHAVRTGESARNQFTGGDFFVDYLPKHPDVAKLFDEAMTSAANRRVRAIVEAYDFSSYGTIADVGGGRGHLIRGILEKTPRANGILFDLPHAVDPVRALNAARLSIIGGDFLTAELPKADCYILMAVIHDWNDEKSLKILAAVRKAAPAHAKMLLIERVIVEKDATDIARRMDIHMLAAHSGRERTRDEFAALLAKAGFKLERVVATTGGSAILESTLIR